MKPAKKTAATLREEAATLEENIVIAATMIRYRIETLERKDKLLSEANEAVQRSIATRDEIQRRIDGAPSQIEQLHKDVKRMKKSLHKISVAPKLAKLAALKAKIAELEGDFAN